ncbi:hypothetical protein SRABI130_01544 [Pseudomonas sp. Bi130]|nr:hypothetical protein SRABI130_01544 [Pseudomonas sp. Bi130]
MILLKITIHIGKSTVRTIRTKPPFFNKKLYRLDKPTIIVHPVKVSLYYPVRIPTIIGLPKQFVHAITPLFISGGNYEPYQ